LKIVSNIFSAAKLLILRSQIQYVCIRMIFNQVYKGRYRMPGFIDGVVTAGRLAGRVYETVEQVVNREAFYNPTRDPLIINAARRIYLEVFIERPLPSELRYHHESQKDNEILPARAIDPPLGRYRPPFNLPEKYSIVEGFTFGKNELEQQCKNAVLVIQNYLNELNRNAPGLIARAFYKYGHQSDAVRFIFHLFMSSFVELSKMDLNEAIMLEEANLYIEFLFRLKHEEHLNQAFREITPIEVGSAQREVKSPLAMLVWSHDELDKVKKVVEYRISNCCIFEQTIALYRENEQLTQQAFTFSTYILAASEIQELDTATVSAPGFKPEESRDELMTFRVRLSEVLSNSAPNSAAFQASSASQLTLSSEKL
jgi:hypothetical protein